MDREAYAFLALLPSAAHYGTVLALKHMSCRHIWGIWHHWVSHPQPAQALA